MSLAPENLPSMDEPCPMIDFVNLISGKWAIPILYRLILINGRCVSAPCSARSPLSRRRN